MGGQSNMVGLGKKTDLLTAQLPENVVYHNFGFRQGLKSPKQELFGPEIGLANALSLHFPKRKFILIKYAIGGASLLDWAPDYDQEKAKITGNPANFGAMYQDFQIKIDSLLKNVRHEQVAVLWMQGERDARKPKAGVDYYHNFQKLILAFRQDANDNQLPFLFGEVNPPAHAYAARDTVREAQIRIANEDPNAFLIETDDLEKWEDNLHYSSKGLLELGRRYAKKLIEIEENN